MQICTGHKCPIEISIKHVIVFRLHVYYATFMSGGGGDGGGVKYGQ